jgi:hypothetical protein
MTPPRSCPIDRPFALSGREENSTPVGTFAADRARTHCLSLNTLHHFVTCPVPLLAAPECGMPR